MPCTPLPIGLYDFEKLRSENCLGSGNDMLKRAIASEYERHKSVLKDETLADQSAKKHCSR